MRKPIKNLGFGAGPIKINVGLGGGSVYTVKLKDAFPLDIQQIELNNDMDGLAQVSVMLSYTNWEPTSSGQGWIQAIGGLGSL